MDTLFWGLVIYEVWNLILVFTLCSMMIFLLGNALPENKEEITIAQLVLPVVAVLIQIKLYSDLDKVWFVLLYSVLFISWKRKVHGRFYLQDILLMPLCSLFGFGWNIWPLILAFGVFLISKIRKLVK
jgi:hypothetical protein|tara:strand:+ start:2678 stop:3061 length:384 start_codon:yes stop_codon:yes gene_type:complete